MNPASDIPSTPTHCLPAWALGLSLAIHVAVLAGPFLQRQTAATDLPPLVVNLRVPAVVAPPAAAALPPPSVVPPAPAVARAPAERRSRSPVPAVLAVAKPVADSVLASAPPSAPLADSQPVPPPRNEASVQTHAAAAAPTADTPDPAAMERYIRLLGDLLAKQQQYPRLAAMRGWEGEVRLRLQVARKGTIIAVQVVHSSGFDVLDQHAVQLVQGTTLPPLPVGGGTSSSPDLLIDVPVHYSLKRST